MEREYSLSTGLHNIISSRPPKTERLLSLFLVSVISLMSLAQFGVMTRGLKGDLTEHYVESNTQKAINLAHQIDRFINTRRIQLEDQADAAVVKQTVMQPDSNKGLIRDYFNNQSIVGKQYAQQLFDFKGDKIFSSTSINSEHKKRLSNLHFSTQPGEENIRLRFAKLYDRHKDFEINLNTDKEFWEIALPIEYGASVEGILISYIPMHEMTSALDLNNVLDINMKATAHNQQVITWGKAKTSRWQTISVNTSTGIQLAYAIDMSSLDNSFNSAKERLIISVLIITLLAIGVSITLGRWFFVRPLEKLQVFASELSEGADPHLEQTKRITIEIQELSDKITDMAKRINQREQALIKSNKTLKKNQDTLVHAEKMAGLGQVTAGVAHEINNPIGFIMNNLTMLQEYHVFLKKLMSQLIALKDKLTPESQALLQTELNAITETLEQEDLDFVINDLDCITGESIAGTKRVRDITQALKGYTYSGEQSTLTDINECIESTFKMVWNELKYNCTVNKSFSKLPKIECMGSQINQVLMNLFINASHAMEGKKGELLIKTESDDQFIKITVSDNGHGIKPENLKHIFDPFFTTKAVGKGTGLGMSICYDIIKNHGGNIEVKSELGVGTCFTVTLPISTNK